MATPATQLTVDQAISNLETAKSTLTNDQQLQANAQAAIDQAQAKLDASKSAKTPIDANVTTDIGTYNDACDQASTAILGSKIPVPAAQ